MASNWTRLTCVLPIYTSPSLSTERFRISGLKSRVAAVAVGRSILIACSLIIVRLAIMNEASRKNMMSISGIISMRAFLCGNGEPIFMLDETKGIVGAGASSAGSFVALLAVGRRFRSALPGGVDHDLNIGGGRFHLELQPRGFAREKVERNERDDGNGEAAHRRDQGFADATGDFLNSQFLTADR